MLELRPNCELCDADLPPAATDAMVCSYECTFCAGCAERVVICSDVIGHATLLDSMGVEREAGNKIFALGVASLLERIPRSFRVEQHAEWQWTKHRPNRHGKPGARMDVEGVLLGDALHASSR